MSLSLSLCLSVSVSVSGVVRPWETCLHVSQGLTTPPSNTPTALMGFPASFNHYQAIWLHGRWPPCTPELHVHPECTLFNETGRERRQRQKLCTFRATRKQVRLCHHPSELSQNRCATHLSDFSQSRRARTTA